MWRKKGEPGRTIFFFFDSGWHVQARGDKAGEIGALFERHQSRTGLGDGVEVGDVTELAAGPAASAFLSAPRHQRLLTGGALPAEAALGSAFRTCEELSVHHLP